MSPTDLAESNAEVRKMAVKADESLAVSRKRQEAERLSGPTWMAVSYALGGLLVAVAGLAFWLGMTLGVMSESIDKNAKAIENNAKAIENNAKAIERLEEGLERLEIKVERGLERREKLLIDILRQRNGDE